MSKFLRKFSSYSPKQSYISLLGSNKILRGPALTKHRGEYLNDYLKNNDFYQFLGTSTGISAVNVVAGGKGRVGPYVGGWQINAMKNRLQDTFPDTLHVAPEEPAQCAIEVNNHLNKATQIAHFNGENYNYNDCALLADLEQGWSTPEKVRIAVKRAVENGINIIHIEDQGPYKRCGHLGDKELCPIDDYEIIMKSANFAAQEILGKQNAKKNWVRFVSRTDAFSAKRMLYSKNLENPNHIDNQFIDWNKGFSPDGKYVYIKQGFNPKTGKKWGLEMSCARTAHIVKNGLASHVWMETPDAELQDAKDFLDGVNNILNKYDMNASGLYNHSPSFDWDIKFYQDAEELAQKIITNLTHINDPNSLRDFIQKNGNNIKGDQNWNTYTLKRLYYAVNDHKTHKDYSYLFGRKDYYTTLFQEQKFKKPYELICDEIVSQRLQNFEKQLASFGYNAHLITLPEYHVISYNMFQLANKFQKDGIHAYVTQVQRPERILFENNKDYKYYKHQTTTGTGLEAYFNQVVGSSNSNILSDSTESDDLKKRNQ